MRILKLAMVLGATTLVVCLMASTIAAQQGPKPGSKTARAEAYTPPKTPWGDPKIEGVYSNDDETGIPFERPAQFEGRRIEDITPEELASLNAQRNQQFNAGVAGTEFAGGLRPPTHLIFDSFDSKNSTPWLVVDPPDGKVPPLTDEARERARRPPSGLGRGVSSNFNSVGPFYSYEDLGLYDRCITRGIPASMMPAGYGSFYEIIQGPESVALRYEMIHEHRVVPIDRGQRRQHRRRGPASRSRRRTRLVTRASRWSSRRPISRREAPFAVRANISR